MNWLSENMGTILVSLVLAGVVAGAVRAILWDRKKGRCSCGHQCTSCPMGGACHHG